MTKRGENIKCDFVLKVFIPFFNNDQQTAAVKVKEVLSKAGNNTSINVTV